MIPIGYLYKITEPRPAWLRASTVVDICSLSGCISRPFTNYVGFWKHNGFWLFDSPAIMDSIALREGVDLSAASLFYYEAHEEEFDETSGAWAGFGPEPSITTRVEAPGSKRLLGYDVVTFSARTSPECSPLSCNRLAETHPVNTHCLFTAFDEARRALENGVFANSEPGPFRIIAVHAIDRPREKG